MKLHGGSLIFSAPSCIRPLGISNESHFFFGKKKTIFPGNSIEIPELELYQFDWNIMNCWNARHKPIEHLEHKIAVCDLETKQQKTARSTSLFQPATTNPMKQSMAGGWFGWMVGWSMYTTNIHQP